MEGAHRLFAPRCSCVPETLPDTVLQILASMNNIDRVYWYNLRTYNCIGLFFTHIFDRCMVYKQDRHRYSLPQNSQRFSFLKPRHSVEMRSPNQAPKSVWNSRTGKLRKRRVFPSRWQCFPVFCSKNEAGNGSSFLEIGNHMKSPFSFTRCRFFHCYKVCFTRVYIP